jgi:peroxiredoxin
MTTAARVAADTCSDSLEDLLGALHAERLRTWDPAVLQINVNQRAELIAAADTSRWPRTGEPIADAPLIDVETGPFRLYERTADAPVVLLFFRFAGCPACNIALPYYNETLWPALEARGVQQVAISPQLPDRLIEIKQRHHLGFAIATDPDNGFARRLGITFVANAATQAQRQPGAPWIGETIGTGTWELPQPAVILLDRKGIIRFIDVSPDWMKRTEPQTIIDAVDRVSTAR